MIVDRKKGQWSESASRVLKERYLWRKDGKLLEDEDGMCARVARAVAEAERVWGGSQAEVDRAAEQFTQVMLDRQFMPNSPTLMNAGKNNGQQLSACFVLPVGDSLPEIFDAIKHAAIIHKSGGGCISGDAHVFTTFCGVEAISTLYERVQATGQTEEIREGHAVMDVRDLGIRTMALNPELGTYAPVPLTHLWRYEVPLADQWRIRCANGLTVTTSAWHPFMVFDGQHFIERRADELKPGDILSTPNASVRDNWPHDAYREVAGITLDEDIAWLLGFYLGDGSLGWAKVPESDPRREKLRWRVFDGRTASLERVRAILAARFNVHVQVQCDARGLYSLTSTDVVFITQFRNLLDVHPGPKEELPFPEMVAKSPLSVVGAFLAGLVDADGFADGKRDRVTFTSTSRGLAGKVHTLCALLGLAPGFRAREPYGKDRSVCYEVRLAAEPRIADLQEVIGAHLTDSLKAERLAAMTGDHAHVTAQRLPIPFTAVEDMLGSLGIATATTAIHRHAVQVGDRQFWLHNWKEGRGVSGETLLPLIAALRPLVDERYHARLHLLERIVAGGTVVQAIERPDAPVSFYDFTVEGFSTYLAGTNGLTAIHNTGFGLSRLRSEGSEVATTRGVASGPVSFLRVFNAATEAVKQGGCVVPDTRVSTTRGIVKIGTLGPVEAEPKSWHALRAPLSAYTDEGSRQVEEFYHNGLAPVRTVRTTHGYEFTGTLAHRVRVIDDAGAYVWRHLQDLKVGDWVVLQKNSYPAQSDYRFTPSSRIPHFNATGIVSPEQPTAELGELIGYFIGDGCINYYNSGGGTGRLILTVADAEPEVLEQLIGIAASLFGVTPIRQKKPNDASTNLFFNSTEMAFWFTHNGVTKTSALDARIPEMVFQAGAEFARGFLRGLFTADGTITVEGYPSLTTISQGLAADAQQLLLSLGIPSSISVKEDRGGAWGTHPIYQLRVITQEGLREFAERIRFMAPAKNARLDAGLIKAWEFNDIIPNQQPLVAALYEGPGRGSGPKRGSRGANHALYHDIQHYLPSVRSPRNLTRSRLAVLAEKHEAVRTSPLAAFLSNGQFYDRVASIEDGEAVTVDLSVEENHTYIANGFVSHNTRRGANMGVLRVDHPDILKFIECKRPDPVTGVRDITNFNISVAATDAFMEALDRNSDYELRDPHTGKVTGTLNAREVFNKITAAAWSTGDPGLLFIDRANNSASNPIPELEQIEATNPCGEQWLGGYDACNLGSINLAECVAKQPDGAYAVNWTELERVSRVTTRFLDNVIEINPLPLREINDTVRANRRVGLGIMGWADLLFLLAIPYDSEAALALGEEVMRFVNRIAHDESQVLAQSRGAFPNFSRSIYRDGPPLRNATLTTVAPTGTISIIADCSSGIEPVFALAFTHMVDRGKPTERRLVMSNPIFARIAHEQGFYSDALMESVSEHGSVIGLDEVPQDWQRVFVNAHEVSPEWHIKMQAAFQHGVDNSISKTVNVPNDATVQDIEDAYLLAWAEGCKGITVFRDGCLSTGQVLNVGTKDALAAVPSVPAAPTAPQPEPPPQPLQTTVKPRPPVVFGYTRQVRAPEGTANITINTDETGPVEVFLSVGRAGSDIAALAEALGRLISLTLRLPSPIEPDERLRLIATQLRGIGGSRSIGFGASRVLSLPDALGQAFMSHIEQGLSKVPAPINHPMNGNGQDHPTPTQLTLPTVTVLGNLCPQCGSSSAFVLEEGCKKCHGCGYSEC